MAKVQNRLVLLAVLFFSFSVIAALVSSGQIAKPFNKIAEQNRLLEDLNKITQSQADKIHEAHQRTKLLMDATPICSMLWDRNGNLFDCNEESVKKFHMANKQDFLDRFLFLSPKHQPNGWRSCKQMMAETLRLKNELEAALKEAQKANQAKSSFLASMSHEMRTQLNAVVGLSELMLNTGKVQGEAEDKLGKIYNSGMTLLGIVNDILDISKIESGKFELHPIEYDTPSLINDLIALNIVRIGKKPIQFTLKVDENLMSTRFTASKRAQSTSLIRIDLSYARVTAQSALRSWQGPEIQNK